MKTTPIKSSENKPNKLKKSTSIHQIMDRFESPDVDIYIRKELNILGKIVIFGIYSIIIFSAGIYFNKSHSPNEGLSKKNIKSLQHELIKAMDEQKKIDEFKIDSHNTKIADQFEKRVSNIIKNKENLSEKLLSKKNNKIDELEEKNNYLNQQINLLVDGNSALNKSEEDKGKLITYTKSNKAIFKKEQRMEIDTLKEKFELREEAFVKNNNMGSPSSQNLYKKLKQAGELELFKIRQTHKDQLKDFYKKKYRINKK